MSLATGVSVDSELVASRLGPPLAMEMANWVPPEQVDEFVEIYRSLYPAHAIEPALLLPGVRQAMDAIHDRGGRVIVVTAKNAPNARLHLDHLGLPVDELVGDLWGAHKGSALLEHGATIYVGDHVHDVAGARAAGAVSVAVATGPCTPAELAEAGADVVLGDLDEFPAWLDAHLLERQLADLEQRLRDLGSLVVAFSGGADSAFLLAAAVRALGPDNVVAATALSDSLPEAELEPAGRFCADLGVRHLTPATAEMERAGYRANAGDRCYFCKAELLDVLGMLAADLGLAAVATGTNADDAVAGFRPGIRAAAERGAVTPLLDAGLRKSQIRAASRAWGLPTWDKPAAACLSSRIAYGIEVTPSRLARVERAEVAVRALLSERSVTVANLRVRDLGEQGRVEFDVDVADRVLADEALRTDVLDAVREAGFDDAFVDPAGFRSGAMNELLTEPARFR